MFSKRVKLKPLAIVCRSLSTALGAGVPIIRSFDMASRKTSDPRLTSALVDITARLKSGEDTATAMRAQDGRFPDLMVDMIHVAEQTGALPEVLRSLSDHYENTLRLRKDFIGQITMPVIQLFAAIFIVAGLIWLLGIIASSNGTEPLDVLGWGMTGTSGAAKWLTGWALGIASVLLLYKVLTASLSGKATVHKMLMRIPIVGGCMQSFAIARFSWAFHLTQDAGMPIEESLDSSLRATSNGAFIATRDQVISDVMEGHTLTEALVNTNLFPEEFISIVDVAESAGTVPEALDRLSPQFEDQARRSMSALASALGWTIWLGVAAFIVFIIFSVVFWYVGMLNDAVNQAM
ncbi:MAG: type II secretion system F family protein [Planctomycetaceae bacterium]|nr:type II secretion system F family protein [Planctomycetaceae bacterium]